MALQTGVVPKKVSSTHGGEYKSACPECGGDDRFMIQPMRQQTDCVGFYACRVCKIGGNSIRFAMKILKMPFKEAAECVGATISDSPYPMAVRKETYRPTLADHFRTAPEPVEVQEPLALPKSNASLWVNEANAFVTKAHDAIWEQPDVLKMLDKRGIVTSAVKKYKIGWNPTDIFTDRKEWGLDDPENKKHWLPGGIVIPSMSSLGDVQRIKIRRTGWKPTDKMGKYIAISGSKSGLTLVGVPKRKQMIVVESELDAYALHYRVSSIAFVVAVGSNIKNPDVACAHYAKNRNLFICADNDDGGQAMWDKWIDLFPHSERLNPPTGKDFGESVEAGLNIREWLLLYRWGTHSELKLIKYIVKYIQKRTVTRKAYVPWEREILLGPESKRAQSGELQQGYRLAKMLIQGKKVKSLRL